MALLNIASLASAASVPDGDFPVEMGPGNPPIMVPRAVLYNAILQLAATQFAATSHTHVQGQITGLDAILADFESRISAQEA